MAELSLSRFDEPLSFGGVRFASGERQAGFRVGGKTRKSVDNSSAVSA